MSTKFIYCFGVVVFFLNGEKQHVSFAQQTHGYTLVQDVLGLTAVSIYDALS